LNLLTPDEVAAFLKVQKSTVYRYIREGKLPAAKIGNQYRVTEDDLEAFVEKAKLSKGGESIE
jgi:excisionase family DNA binding protein